MRQTLDNLTDDTGAKVWWSGLVGVGDDKKPYVTHLTQIPQTQNDAAAECLDYIQAMQLNPELEKQRLFIFRKLDIRRARLEENIDRASVIPVGIPALVIDGQVIGSVPK